MSDVARFWSRSLRGLNFAEHAILRELAEYHVQETDQCYPNMNTLCETFECTRDYVKKMLRRLDSWNLVTRIEWFDAGDRNRQTSNRYKLNLRQHFPDPKPEKPQSRTSRDRNKQQNHQDYDSRDHAALHGAKQGKRILKIMANIPHGKPAMMDGLKEAFFDATAKTTFVTVEAEGYLRDFINMQSDLEKFIRHETNLTTTLTPVRLFYHLKKR